MMGQRHRSWPRLAVALAATLAISIVSAVAKPPPPDQARSFWSFQPVKRPAVPAVKHSDWVRNPIDAFVLVKLEEKGFTPAPPATKVQLLRRAYYDLIGLP